jgi:hypothetical protein
MKLPRGVVALGLVSLTMDLSSEMIHSLLPVFLVTVLGASAMSVGFIEGIAEATASIAKIFSGVISDWVGRRKPLVLIGYGMAALTKPLFPLATGVSAVLVARFLDRIGKGIRGAPRDALIADITPAAQRGAAYGLRQAMDTFGAFAGPLAPQGRVAAGPPALRRGVWGGGITAPGWGRGIATTISAWCSGWRSFRPPCACCSSPSSSRNPKLRAPRPRCRFPSRAPVWRGLGAVSGGWWPLPRC